MPVVDVNLMTQAQYARHRGCSKQAVSRAVAGERIRTFGADKLVDPELADVQGQRNTRVRASNRPATAGSAGTGTAGCADENDAGSGTYSDWRVRREAAEAQTRAHGLHVEWLRLSQQADAATARHGQLSEELAEIDAQLEGLEERKATGEGRFEELDMALGTTQERHVELDDAVIAAERQLADAREQQRALERQYPDNVIVQKASLAHLRDVLKRCRLYDYRAGRWMDFDGRHTSR